MPTIPPGSGTPFDRMLKIPPGSGTPFDQLTGRLNVRPCHHHDPYEPRRRCTSREVSRLGYCTRCGAYRSEYDCERTHAVHS